MTNLIKELTPEPKSALAFFDIWFKNVDWSSLISFVRIHPTKPGALPIVVSISDAYEAISSSGLDDLIWDNGSFYDLYYSAVTMIRPEKGRGGLRHVKEVPGVWVDLDVKPGSFDDQEQAMQLLRDCPLPPTAIVLTGSGGIHAYWRLDVPAGTEEGRELNLRWWCLLTSIVYPISIDRLVDPSRVLRVPGSIRWPKKFDQTPKRVTLHYTNDVSYSAEQIRLATQDIWDEHLNRINNTRDKVLQSRIQVQQHLQRLVSEDSSNKWLRYMDIAYIEDKFNEMYSWDSVLEPLGWTKLGEDEDHRVLWSRPGDGVRKSATTDWPDSPHIMSLFSTAEETGLLDLHDSEIPLTKYRVWVHLTWGGDERSAISSLL